MEENKVKHKHKPIAAGCMMSMEDAPIILTSFSMYFTFIGYGAGIGAVSAAIPALANTFDMSETTLGWLYTARGLGYFCGASSTGVLLEFNYLKISKENLLSIFILIVSALMILMSVCTNFYWMLVEIFVVGLCFGVFDMTCNVLLPELWGLRVGPWMQALHACFGIGAMIGPTLVGATDYQIAFFIIACIFGVPLLFLNVKEILHSAISDRSGYGKSSCEEIRGEETIPMERAEGNVGDIGDGVELRTMQQTDVDGVTATDEYMIGENSNTASKNNELVELMVPVSLRAMFFAYYLVYAGIEVGFFGWIATYALATVTTSESMAAYLVSLFFMSLTFGRLLAIPLAAYVPNQRMLRYQFAVTIIASVLSVTVMPISYTTACVVTCIMGYGVSSLFPLGLTIPQDYGFKVNSKVISFCVMGATIGEMTIPFLVGVIMGNAGARTMPICVAGFIVILLIDYCMIHYSLKRELYAYREGITTHIVQEGNLDVGACVGEETQSVQTLEVKDNYINNHI